MLRRALPSAFSAPRSLRCSNACRYSTPAAPARWADTLLLPKTSFPLYNDPAQDANLRAKTTESLYRWQRDNAKGPLFVSHDGPPYANGDLHMGHALNKILKDIINRYHVSVGHRVHYAPGWDCHGLPIENKVLKTLGVDVHQLSPAKVRDEAEKYARQEVSSQMQQFRELGIMADWDVKTTYRTLDPEYELRQLRIFKAMVEKGLIYRQHRPVHYSPSSRSALAEAELEYNDKHVSHSVYVAFKVDVDGSQMTSPLRALVGDCKDVNFLVWTTTPWTLTANMALAINPELQYRVVSSKSSKDAETDTITIFAVDREEGLQAVQGVFSSPPVALGDIQGSDLIGATYRPMFAPLHPSGSAFPSLPIIPSAHVTRDSGTGVVHCAPAHGAEDYAVMQALSLISSSLPSNASASGPTSARNLVCHVNGEGRFTADVADVLGEAAATEVVGKGVLDEGGRAIVGLLTKMNVLRKVQRYKHRYPYDWKTGEPVIVLATSQWFANLDGIKEDAIAALQDVSFVPAISRNRLESFIRSRSEWCISRQRVWGVPIPALYHVPSGRAVLDADSLAHIMSVLEAHGPRYWWDGPVEAFVPPAHRAGLDDAQVAAEWAKGTDTMDVWFDSGTSWAMLDGVRAGETAGRAFGADVCLEGSDQHRGWFQSQLLTAIGSAGTEARRRAAPYGTLITHGMVLDESGKKMSKSLGNIVSPMTVIRGGTGKNEKAFGTDVLRLWAATVEFVKDMSIGPTVLQQCAETMRKIRNSSRFILGSLGDKPCEHKVDREDLSLADRYVLHRLHKLDNVAREAYQTYNFPLVVNELSYFANVTLSSFYFDINKDCLYADREDSLERRRVMTILDQVLSTMTKVMAPILPHLAEEIHSTLHGDGAPSVFVEPWTPLNDTFHDPQAEEDINKLQVIRSKVFVLLEKARKDGVVKSSLSADVDLNVSSAETLQVIDLLGREEHTLKSLFGVSAVSLSDRTREKAVAWEYRDTINVEGTEVEVIVRPASLEKCPRCWTFTRPADEELCGRCSDVVAKSSTP